MDFEEFAEEAVAAGEKMKGWISVSPAARKAMAIKYLHYTYSLVAAFPLCLPVSEGAMLCNVPGIRYQPANVVMTSGSPFFTNFPIATVVSTPTSTSTNNR